MSNLDGVLSSLIAIPRVLFIKVKGVRISEKRGQKKIEFEIEISDEHENSYSVHRAPEHIHGLKTRLSKLFKENLELRSPVFEALEQVIESKDWLSDLRKLTIQRFLNVRPHPSPRISSR